MTSDNKPSSERRDENPAPFRYPWENMSPEQQRLNEERVSGEFPWPTMSPEEYMARFGHLYLEFSLHRYPYTNPGLAQWMRRFGELIRADEAELDNYRRQFLTRQEYEEVYEHIAAVMKDCGVEYEPPAWK